MSAAAKPLVLCVLDGWGQRTDSAGNAVKLARTPVFDRLWADNPHALLQASQEAVGLPNGQVGNSEVGHMNIGAGRVVLQDLRRLDAALAIDGRVKPKLPPLEKFVKTLKTSGASCHLLGLLSPGGVHSHQEHIIRLAELVTAAAVPVFLHVVTDGRDSPPFKAPEYWERCRNRLGDNPLVTAATLSGRFYAMDRDRRFERVKKAWEAIALGKGKRAETIEMALEASFRLCVSDEFVVPTVVDDYSGIKDGDGLLVANFRTDRVREILDALVVADFGDFPRRRRPRLAACLGMRPYSIRLNRYMGCLLKDSPIPNGLGEVLEAHGIPQLRIAETEKYAHVTFFMNGGRERPFAGEQRLLAPSPRVNTYEACPQMSAVRVVEHAIAAVKDGEHRVIIVNFANPDMVGHTGSLPATIKAVETVDEALGKLVETDARFIITADHGNAELMIGENGRPHTAHTCSPVPVILVDKDSGVAALEDGKLADLAPTMLWLLGLPIPEQMDGTPLVADPNALEMPRKAS